MNQKTIDSNFMQEALELARKGEGMVSPNPMVGAVIVKNNEVIGRGHHQKYGHAHAEVNAINDAKVDLTDSTLYVTLEPCCHTNKQTPPCTKAIENIPFKRIVIAALDPNPSVSGKGVLYLRNQGFEVEVGVLGEESEKMNASFQKFITEKKPFVHIKLAQTLDGKMVTDGGTSKWITDESARKKVHELRFKYDAVVVGKETLINDNPSLTIRYDLEEKGKVPWRVIIGDPSGLETHYQLFNDDYSNKTLMIYRDRNFSVTEFSKIKLLEERGVKFIAVKGEGNWLTTEEILDALAEKNIASILVEGGPTLLTQFIADKKYDKISIFMAPKIVGNGRSFFENSTLEMKDALVLNNPTYEMINNQILIESNGVC